MSLVIGEKAPQFDLPASNGETVKLTDYKDLYMETAVKGTYKSFQEQEGLNNVISISNNKKQALSTDLVSQFPGLFVDDDNHREIDTKIIEPNGE